MGAVDGYDLGRVRHTLFLGKYCVADQSVGPEVGDFDLQCVVAAADQAGDTTDFKDLTRQRQVFLRLRRVGRLRPVQRESQRQSQEHREGAKEIALVVMTVAGLRVATPAQAGAEDGKIGVGFIHRRGVTRATAGMLQGVFC